VDYLAPGNKFRSAAIYFLVLLNFCILVSPGFNSPAHFAYDQELLTWSSAAISHMVWGLGVTKGQLVFYSGLNNDSASLMGNSDALHLILVKTETSTPQFLGRYPPGIGLTIFVFFVALGLHFWVARLATTIFHVGTLLLFTFNLKRHTRSYSQAIIGGILFSTVPMSSYFGRLVEMFMPALFFMTLAVTFYSEGYNQHNSLRRLLPVLLCLSLALFYNWVALILTVVILAFEIKRTDRSPMAIAAFVCANMAALLLVVLPLAVTTYQNASMHALGAMFQVFLHRTAVTAQDDSGRPITLVSWMLTFARANAWGFTPLTPFLALGGVIVSMMTGHRPLLSYAERVNRMQAVVGLLWILILAQGVYVHTYYQYFLLPPEIYYASIFLERIAAIQSHRVLCRFSVFAIVALIYYISALTLFGPAYL
jgi:4-amino-4-deoxy-L-arabinose transferase-like glycosyltransferase